MLWEIKVLLLQLYFLSGKLKYCCCSFTFYLFF